MVSRRKDRIPSGLGLGQKSRHAITGREQPIDQRRISKNARPPPLLKCTKSVGDLDKIRLTWQKLMSTFEARAATSPSPSCTCKQYLPMISDIARCNFRLTQLSFGYSPPNMGKNSCSGTPGTLLNLAVRCDEKNSTHPPTLLLEKEITLQAIT